MKTYSVTYYKHGSKEVFGIFGVVSDGVMAELPTHRYFITKDRKREEIPSTDMHFEFSAERMDVIEEIRRHELEEIAKQKAAEKT